jgi:invasion protein IalB
MQMPETSEHSAPPHFRHQDWERVCTAPEKFKAYCDVGEVQKEKEPTNERRSIAVERL